MNELLSKILPIQSESGYCEHMQLFLNAYLRQIGADVCEDERGNIYATKGKAKTYPCLAAHMDTVHRIQSGGIVPIEINDLVTGMDPESMQQTGIGGDDKCGIYAALYCLHNLPAAKAVFFVDEEIGCAGSSNASMEFFHDCRFVLQADRRGNRDWVTDICGPLGSDAFQKAVAPIIKRFGYSKSNGAMTDVEALRNNGVGISVANMSAGYYNPHSDREYISIKDLDNVSAMMLEICVMVKNRFEFVYERPKYNYRDYAPLIRGVSRRSFPHVELDDLGMEEEMNWDTYDKSMVACTCCTLRYPKDEIIYEAAGERFCADCAWMVR